MSGMTQGRLSVSGDVKVKKNTVLVLLVAEILKLSRINYY